MKKTCIKTIALLIAAAMIAGLAAPAAASPEAPKTLKMLGVSMHTQFNPWNVLFKDLMLKYGAENGVDVIWTDAVGVPANQIENIEDLLAQGCEVLIVLPTDGGALSAPLQRAKNMGVPIIVVDTPIVEADRHLITASITQDSVEAGHVIAEYLAGILGENTVVATLYRAENDAQRYRFGAFRERLSTLRGDVLIVDNFLTDPNAVGRIVEDMLISYSNLAAVFTLNDNSAITAGATCRQLGRNDVIVVGTEGAAYGREAIRHDDITATLANSPIVVGELAFSTAIAAFTGGQFEENISINLRLITKDNVDTIDLAEW